MAVLKCKMCGGTLVLSNEKFVICEYCGTTQTVPSLDNDKKILLHNRANAFRLRNEFDKAIVTYENIVNEFTDDSEGYWGLVLSKYGIEYIDDPKTGRKIPTCHRVNARAILDDIDYKNAIKYSDVLVTKLYEEEAKEIDRLQKEILKLSQKEEPYDIFICYKETDQSGKRTIDSVIAQDIYNNLINEGYKVFFSRITLETKLGREYEPIIYAALNSSKVMLIIGTRPEYFNAVWVKNEWSRFISMITESNEKKYLIPCYKDIDAYDLPEELVSYQCQDLNKLGYMQDLLRGLDKIFEKDKKIVKQDLLVDDSYRNDFIKTEMYLEMNNFNNARIQAIKLLEKFPKNSKLLMYKLLADLKCDSIDKLSSHNKNLTEYKEYNLAVEYATNEYKEELLKCNKSIIERLENEEKEETYREALKEKGFSKYGSAISKFENLNGYKDSKELLEECIRNAEDIYKEVKNDLTIMNYDQVFKKLEQIIGYKDTQSIYEKAKKDSTKLLENEIFNKLNNAIMSRNQFRIEESCKILKDNGIKLNFRYDLCGGIVQNNHVKTNVNNFEIFSNIIRSLPEKKGGFFTDWQITEHSFDSDKSEFNLFIKACYKNIYYIKYIMEDGWIEEAFDELDLEICKKNKFDKASKYTTFVEGSSFVLPVPKKSYMFFTGWYENGAIVTKLENRNYVLEAKWSSYKFHESEKDKIYIGYYPQTLIGEYNCDGKNETFPYYLEGDIVLRGRNFGRRNAVYKCEPILWDILENNGNTYKLVSSKVLDNMMFYNEDKVRFQGLKIIAPNNYELSNVRAFINGYDNREYKGENYSDGSYNSFLKRSGLFYLTEKDGCILKSIIIDNLVNGKVTKKNNSSETDKAYLLSEEDYNILKNKRTTFTDFAIFNTPMTPKKNHLGKYFLRTPDKKGLKAVDENGELISVKPNESYGVRIMIEVQLLNND